MTRLRSPLPFALTLSLLATTALAGPPVEPTPVPAPAGASADRSVLDCRIAGRTERFVIAGDALAEGPGSLSVLAEGIYVVSRDGVTYLIDPTGVQIDQGLDAGKWPCVSSTAAAPAPAPDSNQMARIVELEGQLANLQAALNAANGDRDAAILARDAAIAARDAAQATANAAGTAAQTALTEAAALQTRAENAEALVTASTAAEAAADARLAALGTQLNTALARLAATEQRLETTDEAFTASLAAQAAAEARVAELEATATARSESMAEMQALQGQMAETLAAAEARVAELEAELAAVMTAQEDAAAPVDEGMAEDDSAMDDPDAFDADAALLAIEASDLGPISRAALSAAVEQARNNPALLAEVMARLQNALGE